MKFKCDGTVEACTKCPLDDCRRSDHTERTVWIRIREHEEKRRKDILKYADVEKIAYKECGKPKKKQIDRERIIKLWESEWTTQEWIADVCKCSIATVRKVLREEGFEQVYEFCGETWRKIQRERVCAT